MNEERDSIGNDQLKPSTPGDESATNPVLAADTSGLDPKTQNGLQAEGENKKASTESGLQQSDKPQEHDNGLNEGRAQEEVAEDMKSMAISSPNQTSPPSTAKTDGQPPTEDVKPEVYLDPTPKTPRTSSPSRTSDSPIEASEESGPTAEIKNIMDQFQEADAYEAEEANSGSLETDGNDMGASLQRPPRYSSLEHLQPQGAAKTGETLIDYSPDDQDQASSSKPSSDTNMTAPVRTSSLPQNKSLSAADPNISSPPLSAVSLPKALPPTPDPEPDLPFDFHRFLEQLRHRSADPVARYLRSFLTEFGKKQWMAHEQVKFIQDFLAFIANKMAQCEVWRGVSDAEFDNAREGMEKLVMNRLYSQTFSPAISPPATGSIGRGKKKNIEKLLGSGRRGQHQEDIERDDILSQKVRIYGWIQEEHLDIKSVGPSGKRLLDLAQQELLKIKNYRAPRDKIICVLNCCKVIFGLLRNSKNSDTSADAFVPLLIFVVLHANPEHLVSNVQYILRFRNQDKLGGEAGYYLSSLMGAVQFIENLDRTSLTISDDEFEREVEAAVSAIAERHQQVSVPNTPSFQPTSHVQISEKGSLSQPEVARNSIEADRQTPIRFQSNSNVNSSREVSAEDDPVNGILRSIQRPLSSIGKMFTDETPNKANLEPQAINAPPQPPRRLSPALFQPPRRSDELQRPDPPSIAAEKLNDNHARAVKAEDAAARQASAEAAEAQRIQQAEHNNVVETLAGMFPDLDRDVIDDVVRVKQGRVGLAVDACLALNT